MAFHAAGPQPPLGIDGRRTGIVYFFKGDFLPLSPFYCGNLSTTHFKGTLNLPSSSEGVVVLLPPRKSSLLSIPRNVTWRLGGLSLCDPNRPLPWLPHCGSNLITKRCDGGYQKILKYISHAKSIVYHDLYWTLPLAMSLLHALCYNQFSRVQYMSLVFPSVQAVYQ